MKIAVSPLSLAVLGGMLAMAGPAIADTIKLRIIETTDIHTNIMDYDYYKDAPTKQIGLARTATLVKQAQKEVVNSVLVDNGDSFKVARWVTTWRLKVLLLVTSTQCIKR